MACRRRGYLTPLGRLEVCVDDCVYEPSDDTMAMVASINALAESGAFRPKSVVDIGTGTGILALAALRALRPDIVAAIDVSPYAARAARLALGSDAMVLQCDGASCLRGVWDLAIVNPPYLPSSAEEKGSCAGWLSASWSEDAGITALCEGAARLANNILMLYSSLTRFDIDGCLRSFGFNRIATLLSVRLFMETLYVGLWSRVGREGG